MPTQIDLTTSSTKVGENTIDWVFPSSLVTIVGFKITNPAVGLWLQRSAKARNMPFGTAVNGTNASAPPVDANWVTLQSWTGAQLASQPVVIQKDDTAGFSTIYSYRVILILVGPFSGFANKEIDSNAGTITQPFRLSGAPNAGNTGIVLNWDKPVNGEPYTLGSFTLKRSTNGGGSYSTLASLANTVTTYTDNSVPAAGTTYRYKLTLATAAPTAGLTIGYNDVTINTNFTIIDQNSSTNAITVRWQYDSVPTNFEIHRKKTHDAYSTTEEPYALWRTVAGTVNQTTDTSGIQDDEMWFYKVRPVVGVTPGAFIAEASLCQNFYPPDNTGGNIVYPSLQLVLGAFLVDELYSMATGILCSQLQKVTGHLVLDVPTTKKQFVFASFGVLTTIGKALHMPFAPIKSLTAPKLQTVGGYLELSGSDLISLNVAALASVGGGVNGGYLGGGQIGTDTGQGLSIASFPELVSVQGYVDFSVNDYTVRLTFPKIVFHNGQTIDCSVGQLDDVSVNGILARGVASNVTTATFYLNRGGNAAPTGQGITDKATLLSRGNTVQTN